MENILNAATAKAGSEKTALTTPFDFHRSAIASEIDKDATCSVVASNKPDDCSEHDESYILNEKRLPRLVKDHQVLEVNKTLKSKSEFKI